MKNWESYSYVRQNWLFEKNHVATDEPVRKYSMANLNKRPLSLGVFLKIIDRYVKIFAKILALVGFLGSLGFLP